MKSWTTRWGYEVTKTREVGVLETRDGRFLIHGKLGRKKRVWKLVAAESPRGAQAARLEMLESARKSAPRSMPLFAQYAQQLYERKVDLRELKSAKSRERWDTTLTHHLVPAFGRFPVDEIRRGDVESWKARISKKIASGKPSPRTANGWLSILRVILRTAIVDFDLEHDATLRVRDFTVEEHPTYTEEDPNALTPAQTVVFLAKMRKKFPHFYALTLLGFCTGLRPSTLRPIRRRGKDCDVLWQEAAILVRRSNSLGDEIMNTTKTGLSYRLGLPPEVMAALERHVKSLKGKRKASHLLFPSRMGRLMSRSALDKPFAAVSKAIGLRFTLTPRGMRRTFQDLARSADVSKDLRKAICGHQTDKMSELYATIRPHEMAAAVGRIAGSLKVA